VAESIGHGQGRPHRQHRRRRGDHRLELDPLFDRDDEFTIMQGFNQTNPCPFNGSLWMFRPASGMMSGPTLISTRIANQACRSTPSPTIRAGCITNFRMRAYTPAGWCLRLQEDRLGRGGAAAVALTTRASSRFPAATPANINPDLGWVDQGELAC
jgi:hypothetical protein